MPNWVGNSLVVSGNTADLQRMKEQLGAPFVTRFDGKEYIYSNPIMSFMNIISPTDFVSYYDSGWYDWNVKNWGTKWDIASDGREYPSTRLESAEDGSLMYHFETAWSPALPALDKLAEQYPELIFDYEYEEEQGWGGSATWKDGEMILHSEYDEPNSHADYVERGREYSCLCAWGDNSEGWYDDCPREVEA